MTARRRLWAVFAGGLQCIVALVLFVLSIESIGLVTGEQSSVNWLALPALVLLGSIGLTVAYVAGHEHWVIVGLPWIGFGLVVAALAGIVTARVLPSGMFLFVVQLVPAFLPPIGREPDRHETLSRL